MKPARCIFATVALAAALAACGHRAPAAAAPTAATAPPPTTVDDPATDGPAADAPTATAATSTSTPGEEGCAFITAAGTQGSSPLTILGAPGADGFDMPDICPQQACASGLTVDLPKAGAWLPGVYDLVVEIDAGILVCHFAMAAPGPFHPPARCGHERELSVDCVPPEGPNLGPIMITGAPTSVRIAIAKDGVALADETLHPSYSAKRWDGWDCDPSCRSAKASVSVE